MKYGYARVSSVDQNLERQLATLQDKYQVDEIFDEKVSGKNTQDRAVFNEMMDKLQEGDTLVVSEMSRLGRSLKDLVSIMETLHKRGVHLIIDKENFDTNTASGRMMMQISGAFAEYERAIMLERQKEGIQIAKQQGRYKGRPCTKRDEDNINVVCQGVINNKLTISKAASQIINLNSDGSVKSVGVSIPTFYKIFRNWCSDNKIKRIDYLQVEGEEDTEDGE